MTDIETNVVKAWEQAAIDLGIQFISPFVISTPDGREYKNLGLIPHFGSPKGALICVLDEPSEQLRYPGENYFTSILGHSYQQYDRQLFIDTLDDWQFFGPKAEQPLWYTGKVWGA